MLNSIITQDHDGQELFNAISSFFRSFGIGNVYCRIKIPKVADKNGESCISKMEKVAGQGDVHDPVEKAAP